MKIMRIGLVLMLAGILVAGCSQEADMTAPENQTSYQKDGTEALGDPSIAIMDGSGFAEGGVGMVGKDSGTLDITVPDGATVVQALLYWEGGTTGAPGDDTIKVDGNDVTGTLIGGPTNFFENYWFHAFRADITEMDLLVAGANSFTITDFDFDFTGGTLDENNGVSMVVIYDDGSLAELSMRDGLDMAYFNFAPTLDATVPQTFTFNAESADRMADLLIFAGSVGVGRPNQVKVTTSAGDMVFDNPLGSEDDLLWDSLILEVTIPAGDTSLTVELISVDSTDPRGASMAWVGTGLSVPVTPPPPTYCLGDFVWFDMNGNGCQDEDEMGAPGVEVNLWIGCPPAEVIATTLTDNDGYYRFCDLMPGDYTVQFVAPEGYEFCEQNSDGCDVEHDSNAGEDGITDCVTIVDADDLTIDAALCVPEVEPACLGDFVWEDLNMDGIQDDGEPGREGVIVYLMDCEGNELANTATDVDGYYMFCELEPGDYNVKFMLPMGYEFSPQDQGNDDTVDSDADPVTGMTMCTTLDPGENDMTWDAGIYMPVQDGCTLTIGKWKNWTGLGNGNQEDIVSQYLPVTLGDDGGSKSMVVTDVTMAVDILEQKTYGRSNNGITKLYAQMLAAKLNVAAGASDSDISDYLDDADAFLADYDYMDWSDLSDEMTADVRMWHSAFDDYNNGDIGPGHCDSDRSDDDTDMEAFK